MGRFWMFISNQKNVPGYDPDFSGMNSLRSTPNRDFPAQLFSKLCAYEPNLHASFFFTTVDIVMYTVT